ncbi:MAG TPA: hypothetical protein VFG15_03170 [Amycolatopsis sp.]|nr:hypothetical protein [Amycolatopsis sp.]
MTNLAITPPAGYSETRMRGLWALAGCGCCGGGGEYLVNDSEDAGEPWDPEEGPLLYPQPCDCLWSPPREVLRAHEAAQTRVRLHRERMQDVRAAIGPRHVGGCYESGYWRRWYLVERIEIRFRDGDLTEPSWSMTVRWEDGHRTTHCTRWDPNFDGKPEAPRQAGPAPVPPELQYLENRCRWCHSRPALVRATHVVLSRLAKKFDIPCCATRLR